MAWIESHQTLGQHPKTRRLARYLGVSLPAAVGHLHYLWWWALDYAQDGDLSRYEPDDIADAALWDGDAKAFVEALVRAGFLDQVNDKLLIHDWDDYAGRLIDKRKANSERARRWREKKSNACVTNTFVTHNECATNGATVPNLTLPNHTIPNRTSEIKTSSPAGEGLCNLTPAEICEQQGAQQRECAKTAPGKKPAPTVGKAAGKGEDYSEEFEEFWKLYPRKVEKRRAFRCWKTRLREGASPADIIAASRNYASYCHKRGIDLQFIKHPATFLGTDKPYEEWIAGEEGKTIAQGSQHSQPVPADQRLNLDKFLWPGKGA